MKILKIDFFFSKINGFSVKQEAKQTLKTSKLLENNADLEEKLLSDDDSGAKKKNVFPEEIEMLEKIQAKISSDNRMHFIITTIFFLVFALILFFFIAVKLKNFLYLFNI